MTFPCMTNLSNSDCPSNICCRWATNVIDQDLQFSLHAQHQQEPPQPRAHGALERLLLLLPSANLQLIVGKRYESEETLQTVPTAQCFSVVLDEFGGALFFLPQQFRQIILPTQSLFFPLPHQSLLPCVSHAKLAATHASWKRVKERCPLCRPTPR